MSEPAEDWFGVPDPDEPPIPDQPADWMGLDPQEWNLRAAARQAEAAPLVELTEEERLGVVRPLPPPPDPLPADEAAELDAAVRDERPIVLLERRGPSYRARAPELGLELDFRDVRLDREMGADIAVRVHGRHIVRTSTTLSLTGRDRLAKTTAELAGARTDAAAIRRAIFTAVEAVMEAEERVGAPVDLRSASLALPAGGLHVARPFWPTGSVVLVSPGEAGKSTIARALAVSLAGSIAVIPGVAPVGDPRPVLYVAGEDPVAYWHSRSVEAICRGLGIDRASLAQPIELFDARGRPLHRIARAIAERAADFGAVILDSQQALLPQADPSGGIRDRDSLFWAAVDQSERPTFILAHPNRADARAWQRVDDGRIAGSEVNRDRARMAWRAAWKDELAVVGTSFRRYSLTNVKNNHGPTEAPLTFAAAWEFGIGDDPGILRFMSCDPIREERSADELTPALRDALAAYEGGATTPGPLAAALGISPDAAKKRLQRVREHLDGDVGT